MSKRRRPPSRQHVSPTERDFGKIHALIVFVTAAAVRIAVASSLWDLPLVRTPKLDSFELLSWARRLASGDWTWPVVAQHAPGYPIFLASLLTAGGGSLKFALVVQALVGAATAVFVAVTAQRSFGSRSGLFAGLVYALYGPVVYVETALLSEGLLLFLLALALWALAFDTPTPSRMVVAGLSLGAAMLVRPTALLITAPVVAWFAMRQRPSLAGMCAASMLIMLAPAIARNWSVTGSMALQGYGGLNVYIGDSPRNDGRATFRLGRGWDALNSEAARAGIRDPLAQDRYYVSKTWREIRDTPSAFMRLLLSKALWSVQSEESRDSHSFYFFADQSPILRLLLRWWLLFPLAVVGMVLANLPATIPGSIAGIIPGRIAGMVPGSMAGMVPGILACYLAGAIAGVVFLVVGTRYRVPLVLPFAVFAGFAVNAVAVLCRIRATRQLILAAAVFAAALATSLALHDPRNTNLAEEWAFSGSALITEHRLDAADAAYRRALELDPQSGLAWDGFGLTRLNANRVTDARSAFERAVAIDANSARAVYHLALVDDREGKLADALDGYRRALALSPHDHEITQDLTSAGRRLATELATAGHPAQARDAMQRVVDVNPGDADAWLDLSLLSIDLHDAIEAGNQLQQAQRLGADPAKAAFAADALARLTGGAHPQESAGVKKQ